MFDRILVIGIGLIGGSILKDLKANNLCKELIAYDNNKTDLSKAYNSNLIDKINTSLEESVKESDLIIICTPLLSYAKIFQIIDKSAKDSALITDIGSVKQSVIESAKSNLSKNRLKNFIPSHPIAGSEKSGFVQAKNNLFKDKNFYVTPFAENSQESINKICKLWQNIGSNVLIEQPQKHDKIFALSSHVPHLVSFCTARTIKYFSKEDINTTRQQDDKFARFIRLAFSNSKMWSDIFISNGEAILDIIDNYYIDELNFRNIDSLKKTDQILQGIINFRSKIATSDFKKACLDEACFDKNMQDRILTRIFPLLVSAKIVEPVLNIFDRKIVGAGFLGMTKNLVDSDFSLLDLKDPQITYLNEVYAKFIDEVKILHNLIVQKDHNAIARYLKLS